MALPQKREPQVEFPSEPEWAKFRAVQARSQKFRSTVANLGVLLAGSVLALAMIEIPVRMFWTRLQGVPKWNDRPPFYYVPEDARGVSDFRYEVPKPANTYRIAAIGDSFTFTPYIQFDDSFPKRLERMVNMNNRPPVAMRGEVVNYGRWGASSTDEIRTVRKALDEGADLVVLEITLNDAQFPRNEASSESLPAEHTFGTLNVTQEEHPWFYYWRTLGLVASRAHNRATAESTVRYHNELFENDDSWNSFASALLRMKQLCDERQVKFVAFVFPFVHFSLGSDYPFKPAHDKIYSYLQYLGVPAMNPLPAFHNIPPERLIVAPGRDNHPNEIAHRIVAEQLYGWLERSKLLPEALRVKSEFSQNGRHTRTVLSRAAKTQIGDAPNPQNISLGIFDGNRGDTTLESDG